MPKKYTLEKFLFERGMDETEALNHLQNYAVVSDNCVTVGDVAEVDQQRAMDFLRLAK